MSRFEIKIECADKFELSATLYKPEKAKAAVMIAPATGIKRSFYNSFATFLKLQGYGVICFDYRGIGGSIQGSINSGNASIVSWGKLDMPAVLEELKVQFPNNNYHLIGHSAGGQLIGLMHNYADIKSMFNFGSSTGSIRNMRYPFKLKAFLFLNIFIPINNRLFGISNCQWVAMGEPLPKLVGKQWSRWCNGYGYLATDFGKEITEQWYDQIEIPTIWLHSTDDEISNYKNVTEMLSVFPKLDKNIVTIHPQDHGYTKIGHMKFFSYKRKNLWQYAIKWLNDGKTKTEERRTKTGNGKLS